MLTPDIEVHELLVEPHRFYEHVIRCHTSMIMASLFGTRAKEIADTSLIKRFLDLEHDWGTMVAPGSMPPYDIFPPLKFLPDFLTPWRGWKQKVGFLGQNQHALNRELVDGVRERMVNGQSKECLMQDVLRSQDENGYSDVDIDYLGGVLLSAASLTTAASFTWFLLAMASYPAILKTAQEEVDAFYGSDKMPTGIVGAELPYLTACALEVSLLRRVAFRVCLTRRVRSSGGALSFPTEFHMQRLKIISTRDSLSRLTQRS